MNASAYLRVDKATFFKFVAAQAEGRFEYEEGRIVQQMTGGTRRHAAIAQRFISILERQLDASRWLVTGHARGVDAGHTVRYADVVVEPARDTWDDLSTDAPVLLVEVLSPSTEHLDLNVKPPEYMSLATLLAYVVASQDGPECWVWQRDAAGAFPERPAEIKGRAAQIEVTRLGLTISLAEVYRGIGERAGD
ncbi:MAG TPA: Uma2 family endonuclease [Hyphomicrobiaceae bacterium]|nr:Uma2 family endonuclease [Hyphomicrobiaceae bacterium]